MPIMLVSGNPGSGKTLKVVREIDEARRKGRRVFVYGLNELKTHRPDGSEIGWEPLVDPSRWMDLPAGSLVVIDEAQQVWPASRQEPPADVRELSKHRHYGLDFLLTTQYPNYLMKYARELVDRHEHHVRRFGTASAKVFRWQEGQEDVKSDGVRGKAEISTWIFPSSYFGWYRSADAHTIKARIPRKFFVVGAMALVCLALAGFAFSSVFKLGHGSDEAAAAGLPAASADLGAPVENRKERKAELPRNRAQWLAYFQPVVPGQEWTAPAYRDTLKIGEPPRLYCIASGEPADHCTCLTEQGTRFNVEFPQCFARVQNGQYEPFVRKERRQDRQAPQTRGVGAEAPTETPSPSGVETEPTSVGSEQQGEVWGTSFPANVL